MKLKRIDELINRTIGKENAGWHNKKWMIMINTIRNTPRFEDTFLILSQLDGVRLTHTNYLFK